MQIILDSVKADDGILTNPDDLSAFAYEGFEYEPTLGDPDYPHFIKQ